MRTFSARDFKLGLEQWERQDAGQQCSQGLGQSSSVYSMCTPTPKAQASKRGVPSLAAISTSFWSLQALPWQG